MRKMIFVVGYWPRRPRYLRGRSKLPLVAIVLLLFLAAVVLIRGPLIGGQTGEGFSSILTSLTSVIGDLTLSEGQMKSVLEAGLPMLGLREAEYKSPMSLATALLSTVTSVNLGTPQDLLESQYSYLEEMDIEAVTIPYGESGFEGAAGESHDLLAPENIEFQDAEGDSPSELQGDDEQLPGEAAAEGIAGDKAFVGIYTTHNAERFAGEKKSQGKGENAGVVRVAQVLETTLQNKYKIPVARSEQVHDYPNWNLSYTKSKETAKSLLAKNPSIQVLVDIHRDAGIKEKQLVKINGRYAAKVLIIVGSDQRLANPNWKKNKEFADTVASKMDELYPGLCRGVRVQTGRYNQHVHPRAILLEMGNAKNSLAEAEVSAGLMAHVFSEVLKDLSAKKL